MKTEEIEEKIDWELYVSRENVLLWRYIEAEGYKTSKLNEIAGIEQRFDCKMTSEHLLCNPEDIKQFSSEIKK